MGWWHYGNAQVDATEYDKLFLQPTLLHDLMQIKTFQTFMLLPPFADEVVQCYHILSLYRGLVNGLAMRD